MATHGAHNRPLPGRNFDGNVYRDAYVAAVAGSTQNTALTLRSVLTAAEVRTALDASISSGTYAMEMGPGDAVELLALVDGDGLTLNTLVTVLQPILASRASKLGEDAVAYWEERPLASHVWTGGTLAINAAVAAGVELTDVYCDTVVATNVGTEGYVTHSPANNTKALVQMPADQACIVLIRGDRGTANYFHLFARAIQGAAVR